MGENKRGEDKRDSVAIHGVWTAQGPQIIYIRCPVDDVLFEGTRGGGKTDATIMDFAQHCGPQLTPSGEVVRYGAAWRGILFRKTYDQLRDVISRTKRWYLKFPERVRPKYNHTDKSWTWPDGETLYLRFFNRNDDYHSYHGHEYPWMAWEELCSWPDSTGIDKMRSVCRSSIPGMPRKIRSTANPLGPGHNWVKNRYITIPNCTVRVRDVSYELDGAEHVEQVTTCRIHSHWSDNKVLLAADPGYPARLVQNQAAHVKKAWYDGDWDIVAGGIIDDILDPKVHYLGRFVVPPSWTIFRAFDWGSSHPFSVGWWCRTTEERALIDGKPRTFYPGSLIRIGEWYGWNGEPNKGCVMTSDQIAAGIKMRQNIATGWGERVVAGPADSQLWEAREGQSPAGIMAKNGVSWIPSKKGNAGFRARALEVVRTMLHNSLQHPMEGPGMFVVKEVCPHWVRTCPTLQRDEKDTEQADTNGEDHAWDETCYAATTHVPSGGFSTGLIG